MNKHYTKAILAAIIFLCILIIPAKAYAADEIASGTCGAEGDGSNLTWVLDSDGVLTISGEGMMADYANFMYGNEIITNLIIGDSVTSIGNYAFCNSTGLTSINIPQNVTSIGDGAFSGCTGLTSINIPQNVTSIGDNAFNDCTGLTSLTIGENVASIGLWAFSGCTGLKEINYNAKSALADGSAFQNTGSAEVELTVVFGQFVEIIPNGLFYQCIGLTNVVLPDSVTTIGGSAFSGCTRLTNLTLGENITSIGSYAFSSCTELTSITIPQNVTSIGDGAFSYCTGLTHIIFNAKNMTSIGAGVFSYVGTYGDGVTVLFSETVEAIPANIFYATDGTSSRSIKTVIIGENVTSIGNYAFCNCTGLTNLTIPQSVTSIGANAFSGCSGLTSISIPQSVTGIGGYAFYDCAALISVMLPEKITCIEDGLFYNCTSLTSVTVPDSITSIGNHAFCGCEKLTSIIIPKNVNSIGQFAFQGCNSLKDMIFMGSAPSIGYHAFWYLHTTVYYPEDNLSWTGDVIQYDTNVIKKVGYSCIPVIDGQLVVFDEIDENVTELTPELAAAAEGQEEDASDLTVLWSGDIDESYEGQVLTFLVPDAENDTNFYAYQWNGNVWGLVGVAKAQDGSVEFTFAELSPVAVVRGSVEGEVDKSITLEFRHSCTFENNIALNYYAPAAELEGYSNFRLVLEKQKFNADGSSYTWTTHTITKYVNKTSEGVAYKVFTFSNIASTDMGDEIRAILYADKDGVTYSTPVDVYSIKQYALNRLEKSTDDSFKRLLVDMLNYGAAAQMYFKYNTGLLVNADLPDEYLAYATVTMPELVSVENTVPTEGVTAYYYGKTVEFENNVQLKYYMTFDTGAPAETVKLELTYTSLENKSYRKEIPASQFVYSSKYSAYGAKITTIASLDMGCKVTAKIYDGDTLISDVLEYSIETYAYNRLIKSTDEVFKDLLRMMMKYGKSAENYYQHNH